MSDQETTKAIQKLRRRLESLRTQFQGNGLVPASMLNAYAEIYEALSAISDANLQSFSPQQIGRRRAGSLFISDLYPAIDQLLLLTEEEGAPPEEDDLARAGRLVALIEDEALREHCADILSSKQHFNRAIIVATTVFEDRLRKMTSAPATLTGVPLVNACIRSDPAKSMVLLSREGTEQAGFADLCRGLMELYRNTHHHQLVSNVSRNQALKNCLLVDELLRLLSGCEINSAVRPKWSDEGSTVSNGA